MLPPKWPCLPDLVQKKDEDLLLLILYLQIGLSDALANV